MTNAAADLDGMYHVTSITNYNGPLQKQSDGITEIRQGRTERVDEAGCRWHSRFEWVSDTQVRMVSHADPSEANIDFLLRKENGEATAEAVTYETLLSVKRRPDGALIMSGTITHGDETVFLTLRSVEISG